MSLVRNVEEILLGAVTTGVLVDAGLAAGATLWIRAADAAVAIGVNGHDEKDGHLRIDGGAMSDTLTGGGRADTLTGGAGDDTLDGGAGGDLMDGGPGNDLYHVDDAGDALALADIGRDRVMSAVDLVLGAGQEDLVLAGDAVAGTGNDGANRVIGNAMGNLLMGRGDADTLQGQEGNDTLDGGRGDDLLIGGAGADRYLVADGGGADVVRGFVPGSGDVLVVASHINGTSIASSAELLAVASATADGALFNLGGGHQVLLAGVGLPALDASHLLVV